MSVLFFWMVFICFWFSSKAQNSGSHATDLSPLKDFSEQLYPRSSFSDWDFDSGNCCNWSGITCNNSSRVARLELGNRGLSGNISESLGNMEQLIVLNLSHNLFEGSIPNTILHLPNLEVLDLSSNLWNGWFPITMNLPSLKIFNVSINRIGGPVPVGICINSSNISILDLTDNDFNGVLLPDVGNCISLKELLIASNDLSGELPENLFLLHNLEDLYLQENRFSGQLSDSIGKLSKLVNIDLSLNNFSGHLPDVFDRFEQLGYFSAQSNRFTGRMPDSLANSQTITSLSLRNNSLNGTININCSAMVSLVSLNLATNDFHGPIPETLSNCPKLKIINFARINFSGQVPESFKNFSSLSSISLSNSSISNLTGALEIFQHCQNLTTLILTMNFKGEDMSSCYNLQFPGLRIFVIPYCGLRGPIPEWLNGCSKLQLLDLSWNEFSGSIPPWFGNMSSLFYLDLSNNRLVGEIPKELTEMQSFIDDTISLEEASSDIPFFMRRNCTGPSSKYRQVRSFPPTLALGNNHLNGSIWPGFGNLKELHVLDLNHNNLSGPIPSSLSEMRSMEFLDLCFNNLNGSIPPSLANLTFLSRFSVAHNFLSGQIPVGPQFSTFPNSSFVGNQGLCGDHGLPPCFVSSDFPEAFSRMKKTKGVVIVSLVVALPAVIGFSIALLLGYILNKWRQRHASPNEENLSSSILSVRVSYHAILQATENLSEAYLLGNGAFGSVFKGVLLDGQVVAIKVFNLQNYRALKSFDVECNMLRNLRHRNLCKVISACSNFDIKALVMEYLPNGSLEGWLHGENFLDIFQRFSIMIDIACALKYLHQDYDIPIVHCDIKPSNILLDENMTAYLSDFGIAKLLHSMDNTMQTTTFATIGYIAPEYGSEGLVSTRCDVFSFGIVLMEVFSGKRPSDEELMGELTLRNLIMKSMSTGIIQVTDPRLLNLNDADFAFKLHCVSLVMELALKCSMENPVDRPIMKDIVVTLKNISGRLLNSSHRRK